jgi:transposase
LEKYGSERKAANALGLNKNTVNNSIKALRRKASTRLTSEHDYTKAVPEGYAIKGVSQYIDKDGKVAGQWVKTNQDAQAQAEMMKCGGRGDVRGYKTLLKTFPFSWQMFTKIYATSTP